MIPANTEVTCPVCDTEFTIVAPMRPGETRLCPNCDASLVLNSGNDLVEDEEDIIADEDDEGDDEEIDDEDEGDPYDDRKGSSNIEKKD